MCQQNRIPGSYRIFVQANTNHLMNAVCIYLISRMEQFLEGRQRIRYRRLRFLFFTGCQATEEQDDYSPKQSTTFHRQSLHQRQYTNFLLLKWFVEKWRTLHEVRQIHLHNGRKNVRSPVVSHWRPKQAAQLVQQ